MKRTVHSPLGRLLIVCCFLAFGVILVVKLLSATGVNLPLLSNLGQYNVAMVIPNADNLVPGGRVRTAGVEVGLVQSIDVQPDGAHVVISLHPELSPIHQGATIRVGARSLVEETYLDLKDGTGPALPNGAVLPPTAIQPNVQLHDVLYSLDAKTRGQLGELLRSSGTATDGTKDDVAGVLAGLGNLGGAGHDALHAVAAQDADLRSLVRETTTVLNALDTSHGEIANMVTNADQLTKATSAQHQALEETMRRMPGVLSSASTATVSLTELSHTLAPVARDLGAAGRPLSDALGALPTASQQLRETLPALDDTLDQAPRTLPKIPEIGHDLRHFAGPAQDILRDVNPMLGYLKPYGPEIAAWFANFAAAAGYTDEAGKYYFRLMPILNDASAQLPVDPGSALAYKNAVPPHGSGGTPGPFKGSYPRVEKAPR